MWRRRGCLRWAAFTVYRGMVRWNRSGPAWERRGRRCATRCQWGGALDVSKDEHAAAAETFRGFKGDVENLLAAFDGEVSYDRETAEYFHPGRSARARVNGVVVAQFGQIHPEVAGARKLRQDVFLAEFDLEALYRNGLRLVKFTPLGKYPAVERDFSL